MTVYLLRRLWYSLWILVGVNLLTFILFFTVNTPDDMARLNIGGKRVTQEQIDKWKAERGYDRPLYWNAAESGSEKLTRTVLDPATLQTAVMTVSVGDRGVVRANDTVMPAFRVETEFRGLKTTSWVTDTGEVVREESPLGLMTIRESPERAYDTDFFQTLAKEGGWKLGAN